jgi:hypothetical protein
VNADWPRRIEGFAESMRGAPSERTRQRTDETKMGWHEHPMKLPSVVEELDERPVPPSNSADGR